MTSKRGRKRSQTRVLELKKKRPASGVKEMVVKAPGGAHAGILLQFAKSIDNLPN